MARSLEGEMRLRKKRQELAQRLDAETDGEKARDLERQLAQPLDFPVHPSGVAGTALLRLTALFRLRGGGTAVWFFRADGGRRFSLSVLLNIS